jgi:hypothetical protein
MKHNIVACGLALALVTAGSTAAFAKKAPPCNIVGFWTASVDGGLETETFEMTTNKAGTSPDMNPECNNETSKIKSTKITSTTWNTSITSKKCSVVITTAATFNTGVCNAATGTITVPGIGTLPLTLTENTGAKRSPSRASIALMDGFK